MSDQTKSTTEESVREPDDLLQDARLVAHQRAQSTGEGVYLYRYLHQPGYAIRDIARGRLPESEAELVEVIGTVPS